TTTFITTGSGNLSTLLTDVAGSSPLNVGLYTDSGGQPETLLESWIATIPTGPSSFPPVTVLTSVLQPFLAAATQYWVVFAVAPNQVTWTSNESGVLGGVWRCLC